MKKTNNFKLNKNKPVNLIKSENADIYLFKKYHSTYDNLDKFMNKYVRK